jgi:hypothetical protein
MRTSSVAKVLLLGTALTVPLYGASTGTTQLHMPQGSGSGTAFGDYVSDANGLNTSYHYYVEVPAGLSRMVVDIFDADVGVGGTAEAAAGRDRDRGTFNTSVTYSLFNPSGAQRNTQFTTGDATGPTGADNAWLTLFDTTGDTVRDNFTTVAYTNNDGLMNWAGNWIETNDNNSATNGQIEITGGELRIGDNGGAVSTIEREANLSGFTTATFSFDFRTTGVDAGDQMRVEVSNNGGTSWTTLETFTGPFAASSRSYNITSSIAANTRIRFIEVSGYGNNDFFFVDNLQIKDSAIKAGHWEVRIDQSSAVTAGDSINAIGIRAHDGTSGAGGTELNVYVENQVQLGANPPASGTNSRSYTLYPWLTSGCSASKNDFDYDSNNGGATGVGSMTYTSRSGAFTQSYASAALSVNDTWKRDSWSGWTSDQISGDYGIWTAAATVTSYLVNGAPNGNYAQLYLGNYQAAANPPAANPVANSFRIYLPNDAGTAPSKPYVDQTLTFSGCGGLSGPNPPAVGQTSCYTVTVRVVNPAAQAITFSASNLVTANIPGGGAVYAGTAQVSQGSVVSQPAVGGTGNITWNPGSVAAGATALLAYRVKVTPTTAGQRIPVTATPASGNGTRAQYVDETGNTTQTRATYLFGPLCELATTVSVITEAVVSDVHARRGEAGGVQVEWRTAAETGTAGFYLHRWDKAARRWVRVSDDLLAALQSAPQGGAYRFLDEGASPFEPQIYLLEEVEAAGGRRTYGPYALAVDWQRPGEREGRGAGTSGSGAYERAAWPAAGRGAPAAHGKAMRAWTGGPAGAHLTIRETGLYYLRSADIATWLGVPQEEAEAKIAKGKLELTRGGQPVAWMPDLLDQRKRTPGLYFYGEALDSVYAAGSIYHLQQGTGLLMETRPATLAAGAGDGTFPERLHVENDAFPATVIDLDPDSDYWFWEFLQAGDATYGHHAFAVDAPSLGSSAGGSLTVNLQGATDSGVAGEHHALVSLNGTPLGETSWQGITARSATFDIPPGVLRESGNQIEVTAVIGAGAPYSILYVDSFDLAYRRSLRAAGDALAFTADTAQGTAGIAVAGFSAPAVRLLDVSDPLRPRWLTGVAAQADPGAPATYRLGFVPQAGARYLAAAPAALKSPAAVRPWSVPSLLSSRNRADYLVIAPSALLGAAQRLADLRRSRGLTTLVAGLEQVFDEFGAGVPTPHALQSFLTYAWTNWSLPPRYVVLAGAGTLDYRNLLGYGDCLVPPLLVQTPGGLFPSDSTLADVDGDGVPEMALGRIPVMTAAGLDAYTAKVAASEGGTADWARNVLLLSDNDDGATSFAVAGDRIAGQLGAGYAPQPIALSSTPLAAARDQLFAGLSQGASLVNYMGHGGLDRLSAGGLLTSGDVAGLANGDRLPVVTAMTCTINRFAVPGVPSLGEVLLTGTGGAAAVWGPSALADNAQSQLLAERFYHTTADPADPPLGDRIRRAFGDLRSLGGDATLLRIYNLLGDPALRLRHSPAAPGAGGSGRE